MDTSLTNLIRSKKKEVSGLRKAAALGVPYKKELDAFFQLTRADNHTAHERIQNWFFARTVDSTMVWWFLDSLAAHTRGLTNLQPALVNALIATIEKQAKDYLLHGRTHFTIHEIYDRYMELVALNEAIGACEAYEGASFQLQELERSAAYRKKQCQFLSYRSTDGKTHKLSLQCASVYKAVFGKNKQLQGYAHKIVEKRAIAADAILSILASDVADAVALLPKASAKNLQEHLEHMLLLLPQMQAPNTASNTFSNLKGAIKAGDQFFKLREQAEKLLKDAA